MISADQVPAAETARLSAKADPIIIQEVLNIGRQAPEKIAASLDLICSKNSTLHLVLTTRLPGPRWAIETGRDTASLFIGNQEQKVEMALVKRGRDLSWLEAAVLKDGEGDPDILLTTPLAADDATAIGSAFGNRPPSKVSVIGYAETGVFMTGIVAGRAVSEFSSLCLAR